VTADRVHWDRRYTSSGERAVSWYEERPTTSLELLAALRIGLHEPIIDVGAGASTLVDHLLQRGHTDLTVLDVSAVALNAARSRVGMRPEVRWIEHDLLTWQPNRRWAAWHDRAVLHFLVADGERAAYTRLLRRALQPQGGFVIGTFAEDGPTACSGLRVRRNHPDELTELLGDIEIVEQRRQVHHTPNGVEQPFNWIAGRLLPDRCGTA
jgi:SAM-dependent methyltransferase